MNPTRRDMCQAGILGAVALVLGGCNDGTSGARIGGTAEQIPPEATGGEPYALSLSAFSPQVGTRFLVADANGAQTALTLVSAVDLGISDRPVADRGECFVLAFESHGAPALEQNTYAASHALLGTFPLFIVPGAQSSRQTYSAVFNRI
jgi:hypothetical protein